MFGDIAMYHLLSHMHVPRGHNLANSLNYVIHDERGNKEELTYYPPKFYS